MGNNLNCTCRNTKNRKRKTKLSSKLSKNRKKIEEVKVQQPDVVKNLGRLELQIVEDRIREADKQCKQMVNRIDKRISVGSSTDQNVEDFNLKMEMILTSFEAINSRIQDEENVSYLVTDVQNRLLQLKNLEDEISKEEASMNQLQEEGNSLLSTTILDNPAHQQLQKSLSSMNQKYSEVLENVASSRLKWNQRLKDRENLQKDLEEVNRWLQNKEADLEKFLVFDTTKSDVERQKKNCQKFLKDINAFNDQLKSVFDKGRTIGDDCCPDSKAELLHKLSGLKSRYGSIKNQAQVNFKDLGHHFDLLCKFQSKNDQLKNWLKNTEIKCSTPLHLDCATPIIKKQFQEYQKLESNCKENCKLLQNLESQSSKLKTRISTEDQERIQQQIESISEKILMLNQLVCDRFDQLKSALNQQDEVDEEMESLSSWLDSIEVHFTPLKSIGSSSEEAKKLHEHYQSLSGEFETKEMAVAKLRNIFEKLTRSGQTNNMDQIQRLLTKYSLLKEQVVQMEDKCLTASGVRQQFTERLTDVKARLDQATKTIDIIKKKNIPWIEKLQQYKSADTDVQGIEVSLNQIVETAHQIDVESSSKGNNVTEELQVLQKKINALKMSISQDIQDGERKELEGKEKSESLDEMIFWLELRIKELTCHECLDLNLDKLNYTRQKQEQLFQESLKRMKILTSTNSSSSDQSQRQKAGEEQEGEDEDSLKPKLKQIENLHKKMKSSYKEKDKLFSDGMADRRQLEQSIKEVTAWVNGAEKLLECRCVNDSDHQNLQNQLEEIKEYLSEASLCQDEMELILEISTRMVPSLSETDKTTLDTSVTSIKGRQESVMLALQDLQDKMEARIDQWNEFHGLILDFETIIQDLQKQWSTILNALLFTDDKQIIESNQNIQDFAKSLDDNKALIEKINNYGKELDTLPSPNKESEISLAVTNVNDQWNLLKTQTQEKLRALSDISIHLECVNTVITKMDSILSQAEDDLCPEKLTLDISADDDTLDKQIETIEIIQQNLNPASDGIISLKESANTLLQRLPTAEAKVHSQDQLLRLNETYERLSGKCQEHLTLLLEEKTERRNIMLTIEKTTEFLEDSKLKLHQLVNSCQDDEETDKTRRLEKLKLEVDSQLKNVYSLMKLKESKYQSFGVNLPQGLNLRLEALKLKQTELQKLVADQENLLEHLDKNRQIYHKLLEEIRDWLTETYLKLKRRIKDINEDMIKHKELIQEFELLKTKLSSLRSVGDQIVQNSPDSVECQKVHCALAELNKRHASFRASAAKKTQQLKEAETLLGLFNETAKGLETWFDQAEEKTKTDIQWDQLDRIQEQFQIYKELSSELVAIQIRVNNLDNTLKHLRQTCEANGPLVRMSSITQRLFNLNGQVDSHLPILEDANARLSHFENQVKSLHNWLLQTQHNQKLSEPSLNIQDRLLLHEKLLDDIERQKCKADELVKQLPQQVPRGSFQHPQYMLLIKHLVEFHYSAKEHHFWLLEALQKQEANTNRISLEHSNASGDGNCQWLTRPFSSLASGGANSTKLDLAQQSAIFDCLRQNQKKLMSLQKRNRQLSKMDATNKRTTSLGLYFPKPSHGLPQISTSTPKQGSLQDSGVSLSHGNEKSLSHPTFSENLSQISASTSLTTSLSFDDLNKTDTPPPDFRTRHNSPTKIQRNKKPRDTSSRARSFYSRKSISLRSEERLGARRRLFAKNKTLSNAETPVLSQSLPDMRWDFQNAGSSPDDQPLAEKTNELQRSVVNQPHLKVPNMLNPQLNITIQNISSKLQFLSTRLLMQPPVTHVDIQHYITEQKDLEEELVKIKTELNSIQDLEKSNSDDPQALNTTLSMLSVRIEQIERDAADRSQKLQAITLEKEEHCKALSEYKAKFAKMEKCLQEKQNQFNTSSQILTKQENSSVEMLLKEIEENKLLHASVQQKMKDLSDMAVQCDTVCKLEPHDSAEELRLKLVELQKKLGLLKLNIVKHLTHLGQAVKETQTRQRIPPEECDISMKSLEEWVCDTPDGEVRENKETYREEYKAPSSKPQDKRQEKLHSDFLEHRKLVETISTTLIQRPIATSIEFGDQVSKPADSPTDEISWSSIHARLLQSKQVLLDRGQAKPLALHFSSARYLYNDCGALKNGQSVGEIDVEQALTNLDKVWKKIKKLKAKDPQILVVNQEVKKFLMTVSDWLDQFETVLFMVPPKNGIQKKLKENEAIRQSVVDFQEKMKVLMQSVTNRLNQELSEDEKSLMNDSLTQITDRMLLLISQIEIHADDMNTWKRYEEKITKLRNEVLNFGSTTTRSLDTEAAFSDVIQKMGDTESQIKELEKCLFESKSPEETLESSVPNWVMSEFTNLQMAFMDVKRQLMDKKANFLKVSTTEVQYEKILKDYADFLEIAENKLKTKIIVRDFDHLKQQLRIYKEFFSDMENYQVLLDLLVKDCSEAVREQHHPEHKRLGDLTNHVQDLANLHGQRLNSYVNQWNEFNIQHDKITTQIKGMDKLCRSLSNGLEESENLSVARNAIQNCLETQEKMTPEVFQAVELGKEILHNVNSTALHTQVTSLANEWSHLFSFTSDLSGRVEEAFQQIEQYKKDVAIWTKWIESSRTNLTNIRNLQENDAQNISVIRQKMDKLLEFRKDIENESALKEKLVLVCSRLQHNHPNLAVKMDVSMTRIEEQWAELKHDIGRAEQILHQAEMDLMPSRQALNELIKFVDKLNKNLQEDKKKAITKMNKVIPMLNKYKKFKIEMENKALTIDFVKQHVLKPNEDDDSPSALEEKQDFAKRLSKLQEDWSKVDKELNQQLCELSTFQEKWEEFDQFQKSLLAWFTEMEEKTKRKNVLGTEVNVKHTLKECQVLQENSVGKEVEINSLKTLGNQLLELKLAPTGSHKMVKEKVENLQKKWQAVCNDLEQQEKSLQEVLGKWNEFSSEKGLILDLLAKLEYYLSGHSNFIPGNYYSLKIQLSKMKSQYEEIKQKSDRMELLTKLSNELSQMCESPIKEDLQKNTRNIQNRWQTLSIHLQEHIEHLENLAERWRIYKEKYQSFDEELCEIEKSLATIVSNDDSSQIEKHWVDIQELHDKLDVFQSMLSELYQLIDEMGPNLDTLSVINITSQQTTLEERLLELRHSADRFHRQIKDIRLQFQNFEQDVEKLNSFLKRVENVLENVNVQEEQLSLSTEEALSRDALIQFKELLVEFNINATLLDNLNELGYQMALDEEKVRRLQDLNHKWYQLHSQVDYHCHCLQDKVLLHQNFTEKCAAWMTHLAEIESILAENIGGSFEELLNQQKKYQSLTSELTNKQQLLHAIIADGQKMQMAGDTSESDSEHNFMLLSSQWQNVVRRINQRKTEVDTLISKWKYFNEQTRSFERWLDDKKTILRSLDVDAASIKSKRNFMEKVKYIQNEFKMQDDRYNSILLVSYKLLEYTSDGSEYDLQWRLKQLQDKRAFVMSTLELQTSKLESALKQWESCDEQVEELLAWFRDMHHINEKPLPVSNEDLETELQKCQDLQVSCSIYEDKYQVLFVDVNQLNPVVQPEDVSLLQQRMRLWHKRWTELCVQIDMRILQIKQNLEMWAKFNTSINNFCKWCEQMETNLCTMNGKSVELMLTKIKEEYEPDLNTKAKEKDDLIREGKALQKCSSTKCSSYISQQLDQIKKKWQHLNDTISNRKQRLNDTSQAMQQFDRDTANLQNWLQQTEDLLNAPLSCVEFSSEETEKQQQYQNDLRKDIEHHRSDVLSVLNLCEVLLRDSDACPTDKESQALNKTKNNLKTHWENISQLLSERETRIKTCWTRWQSFTTDYDQFSSWLDETEKSLERYNQSSPDTKNRQYKYYQNLQQKIREKNPELESLEKQYELLVKAGPPDLNKTLKKKVEKAKHRWQELSGSVQEITKKTKLNAVTWEEYNILHKTLLDWLNNVDSQIREFEKEDFVPGKDECLKNIQKEEMINSSKFSRFKYVTEQLLNETGDIQNSQLQLKVDEFYDLHDWVIGRLKSLLLPTDKYPEEPLAEVEQDDYREIENYLKSSPPITPMTSRRDSRGAATTTYSVNKDEWWLKFREELSSRNKEHLDAYNEEMLNTLDDCAHKLIIAEEALRCHTPVGPELDHQTKNYIKTMSDCQASVENVQRVYTKIKNDLGLTTIVTIEQEVSNVKNRWTHLRSRIIEKDLKIQNNRKDWSQFKIDLENIIKWLKAQDNWLNSINVSEININQMGAVIKELKDFQDEWQSKQAIVESLKLTGGIFCQRPLEENRLTECQLRTMNVNYEEVKTRCEHLVSELKKRLSESDYFYNEVEQLLLWISCMESKVQDHQLHHMGQQENNTEGIYDSLMLLKNEIKEKQPQISALKETSRHLQRKTKSAGAKPKDDIHIIDARTNALLCQIKTCLAILKSRLDFKQKTVYQSKKKREWRILSPFHFIRKLIRREERSSSPSSSQVDMADSDTTRISDENSDDVDAVKFGFKQEDMYSSATDPPPVSASVDTTVLKLSAESSPKSGYVQSSSVDQEPKSFRSKRKKKKGQNAKDQKDKQLDPDDKETLPGIEPETLCTTAAKMDADQISSLVDDEDETDSALSSPCSCSSFCRRAFWIALPIQALLLLLLGLASLLPMTEDDYSCALSNNMHRTFTSVLNYIDGPPPV